MRSVRYVRTMESLFYSYIQKIKMWLSGHLDLTHEGTLSLSFLRDQTKLCLALHKTCMENIRLLMWMRGLN